jgi:pimeloyl-ACP methyl ester carboxylesterase
MSSLRRFVWRALVLLCVLLATLVAAAPAVAADKSDRRPALEWRDCGEGFECATVEVPREYRRPRGRTLELALIRLPAQDQSRRIGSLFVNYGGPGAPGVEITRAIGKELFASLNDRFDIVSFDPRGVGESKPAIDCRVNQETEGIYRQPFPTPENLDVGALIDVNLRYIDRCLALNPGILPYVSTANVARDMDLLRKAVGDDRLTYLGFSYGTFLGATYASLFPNRYRALVLDGGVEADQYINRPMEQLREQSSAFERALGRFFQACAANQAACHGFGGEDPWGAFDELVERLASEPQPASPEDPRLVDGDDALVAAIVAMYAKQTWPVLAQALAAAQAGDYSVLRALADAFYFRLPDGSYDPSLDRYFTIGALEQRYPSDIRTYLDAGRHSWGLFDHIWWNSGYVELPYGLYPVRPRGVYYGPFRARESAPTTLVIGTTYDPATSYRQARRLVTELGNARLLTMRGDGHTAYGGNSPCIDAAVDVYLEERMVPAPGTVCRQQVPFAVPAAPALGAMQAKRAKAILRPHAKPVLAAPAR